MTWNLQWLADKPHAYIHRDHEDFAALRRVFHSIMPDVLAFQEVDSIDSVYRIVPQQHYTLYFSSRAQNPADHFQGVNQYTGFAVKKRYAVTKHPDLTALSSPRGGKHYRQKLRYGAIISLSMGQQAITFLNVHLKSGCFSAKQRNTNKKKACRTLNKQLQLLETWIQQQSTPFLLLGDFNHRITSENTIFTPSVTQPVRWLTQGIKGNCLAKIMKKDRHFFRRYTTLIDHAFGSTDFQIMKAQQVRYRKEEVKRYQLSDHCPIVFELALASRYTQQKAH